MKPSRSSVRNERGIALVIALLALLVISMLSIVLMSSLNVETKVTGHSVREGQALNVAEAGVGEAMAQIRAGNVTAGNPRAVSQVYLAAAGSLPAVGVDTTAIPTAQPNGGWLPYSTATKGSNVLTIEYRTDGAKTVIYKYDGGLAAPVQTASGQPIYRITSTGRTGSTVRRVVTEVMQKPVPVVMKGACVFGKNVAWSGNDHMCGYNHRADTPAGKGDQSGSGNGRTGAGGCNENPGASQWETNSGNITGMWSSGAIGGTGGMASGVPATSASQPGFYAGPWEPLGMTQAEFWAFIGARKSTMPASINGLNYIDDDATTQNQSGAFTISGLSGTGMLYVDGDLAVNGNVNFKGLVYVEGNLNVSGHFWCLGGLVVRGQTSHDWHANSAVLYSSDMLTQALSQGADFVTLSWREVTP
jgi:Tfp pilus assembly protein PilX